jgi:Lrp/AsnC family transcriptional regulator, leucine-responsive regulatory protein
MKVLSNKKHKKILLQKKDKRILNLLCSNVRLPTSKISKLLKTSRQTTEYRINVFKREHILAGSRTVINIKKLGYHSFHFFTTIQSTEDEKKLIERCKKSKYVNALISYSGKYNYEVSIMAKSPEEANNEFLSLINNIKVIDYFPTILLQTITSKILPEVEFMDDPEINRIKNDPSFTKSFKEKDEDYKIDSTDLKILYDLSQNANLSLSELGTKLNLTKDTISYRIKKLISSNYIFQFRPVIDFSVLNLKVQTVLIRTLNRTQESDNIFNEFLKSSQTVLWATELFGNWDYLIYVITEQQEEIHNFVQTLRNQFGNYIQQYEILFAYQEYKYSFMSEAIKS